MNVLVPVDHAVGVSGPHRNVVGSLNALCARGDTTVTLLTGAIDESEPYARSANLRLHLGFDPHRPARIAGNVRRLWQAAQGCDVVYVPTNLKSFLYAQLVRRGRRLVAGPNVTHLPVRKTDAPGRIELLGMCDLWLEASEARRRHVTRASGVTANVRCIRHSIDSRKFSPERRSDSVWTEFALPADRVKVVYVGRDNEVLKGVTQLLDAAEIIARAGDAGRVTFVLVGRMSDRTLHRIEGMDNVIATGFRKGDELATLYASADISIVPSSWENMPFTVLEAMSSGLAVIASRIGGIPEQIEDGVSGILLDLADERSLHRPEAGTLLAEAILGLVRDPERRRSLALAARARVLSHFSEERLGRELYEVLRPASVRSAS